QGRDRRDKGRQCMLILASLSCPWLFGHHLLVTWLASQLHVLLIGTVCRRRAPVGTRFLNSRRHNHDPIHIADPGQRGGGVRSTAAVTCRRPGPTWRRRSQWWRALGWRSSG